VQLISNSEIREPITDIRFAPGEQVLAVATSIQGGANIYIMEHNIRAKQKEKVRFKITEHKAPVTDMQWSDDLRLFSGDEEGNLFMSPIGLRLKSTFFTGKTELLFKCDSRVVQLDFDSESNQLLASSFTKSIAINFSKQGAIQVGTKLREGPYGGCHFRFVTLAEKSYVVARPGRRLWRAEMSTGAVKQTLNFKVSLTNTRPTNLANKDADIPDPKLKNVNFFKLLPFSDCLLSWTDRIILLIDVDAREIVQWHCDLVNIQDLAICDGTAFILYGEQDTRVSKIEFDVSAFLERLAARGEWKRCFLIVQKYSIAKLDQLDALMSKLDSVESQQENELEFRQKFADYIKDIREKAEEEERKKKKRNKKEYERIKKKSC